MMLQQHPPNPTAVEGGSSGGGGEEVEMNSGVGNRWPRQETIALLKIRSDMDVLFKDSSLKGPLWEEVSRKLAELGYHRSAKKCKEKFENVYKYHRRTKDGRTSKSDGKTYRFFDQLEAFKSNPLPGLMKSQGNPQRAPISVPQHTSNISTLQISPSIITVSLNKESSGNCNSVNPYPPTPHLQPPAPITTTAAAAAVSNPIYPFTGTSLYEKVTLGNFALSSSTETLSDKEPQRKRKRKRKWKEFFERLTNEVVQKQEELQRKFLEALEKFERDGMIREQAWRMQEMAKINQEHDLLVQERSITAAKDTAVIAFLQKLNDEQNNPNPNGSDPNPNPNPLQIQVQEHYQLTSPPQRQVSQQQPLPPPQHCNGEKIIGSPSPSRWPKSEIQALIKLKTNLDLKYQENAPKGPLWEEISADMRKLGFNRNAKRCKEKWENINKYYKKVKESNKKRPDDAKTCPYFHQLEQIYKERAKASVTSSGNIAIDNPGFSVRGPENHPAPIMAQPEQQWPITHQREDNKEQEFSEDEADGYEIVTNKPPSIATTE